MVLKPTGEAPTQTTIRLKEHRNVRIDKIMKLGMFKQALYKDVMSTFLECFMGMDIMSGQEYFPYPLL